ncbi:MAG: arsenic resistance protein [Longimicrobiales bacterium]
MIHCDNGPAESEPLLERVQVAIYLAAITVGVAVGTVLPELGPVLTTVLWPVLGLLLFVTFVQTPLNRLGTSLLDRRFVFAAVVGNFVLVPLLIWGLLHLAPTDPAIRLGVLLVLLVPCTDWFIPFARMGGGDAARAIAFTPLSLLLQLALLPVYLQIFVGSRFDTAFVRAEMLVAFFGLILLPLLLAFVTQEVKLGKWADRLAQPVRMLPVPLLAFVVFLIAAAQSGRLIGRLGSVATVLLVFALYLVAAALLAKLLASALRLPATHARVLAFSFGTRNSFVVLPLALALPSGWEMAALVIVLQSLVELIGMAAYVVIVPRILFR